MQNNRRPPIWTGFKVAIFVALVLASAFWLVKRSARIAIADKVFESEAPKFSASSIILWAWERPEDLSFIDPQKTEVAFLSKTIYLRGNRVVTRPRLQPLKFPAGTNVIPVARIESDREERPALSSRQLKETATEIAELATLPGTNIIQVDFDAMSSERQFYRNLLLEVRKLMPKSKKLSITALASWCEGDKWLEDLPIDEAVPMLFRMGADSNAILSTLSVEGFSSTRCRTSAGVSIDEPLADLPSVARLYVFNPNSWTAADAEKAMETHKK